MLIVGTDPTAVEADLVGGGFGCPVCGGGLRPWGHGVEREVRLGARSERRRFRRSMCGACARTHVLVPEDTLVRRRDAVAVIGTALVAKAGGAGHRRIAAVLGLAPSTVRSWLRRFGLWASRVREHFVRWAHVLDPGRVPATPGGSVFSDAVDAVGVVAAMAVRRFGPRPPWSLASVLTGGGLLSNTSSPWAQPM